MTPLPTRLREADTARVPIVAVPVELLDAVATAMTSLVEWSDVQTPELMAYFNLLIADLRDALAAH